MIVNVKLTPPEINVILISIDYALENMGDDSVVREKVIELMHKLEGYLPDTEVTQADIDWSEEDTMWENDDVI